MLTTYDVPKLLWTTSFLKKQRLKYAIYGAGKFTASFLSALRENKGFTPEFVFDDSPQEETLCGVQIRNTCDIDKQNIDIVILGTDAHQDSMRNRLETIFTSSIPIIDLALTPSLPNSPKPVKTINENKESLWHCLYREHRLPWNIFTWLFRTNLTINPFARLRLREKFKFASIIILAYNNIEITRKSLDTLIKHTYFPFELIIIDNGSNEEAAAWFREFVKSHENTMDIKLIRRNPSKNENRQKNIYSAKNEALKQAKGDILIINDNDIEYTPYWLYYGCEILSRWPDAGIVGLQRYKGWTHMVQEERKSGLFEVDVMNTVEGCNIILTRDTFNKIGYFSESPQNYEFPFQNYHSCDVEYTYRLKDHNLFNIVPRKDFIFHMKQPRVYA